MNNYVIFTDSCVDLPHQTIEKLGLKIVQLEVIIAGEGTFPNDRADPKQIYEKLRSKKELTTSAVSIEQCLTAFESVLQEGKDILYLGFSSALSGTYSAAKIAAEDLSVKYPSRKIYTVDTLCASMGQGLLVFLACKQKESGADIEAVKAFAEQNKLHLCHWFTVNDLFFLKRGGRINTATAVAGTLLNMKPVMHVDNEGRLVKVATARGRKASIHAMLDKMKQTILPNQNETVFISHGDCVEDANYLADLIRAEFGIQHIEINYVGPVIGTHSGPGTLALFFLGKER